MRYLRPSCLLIDSQTLLREAVLVVDGGQVQAIWPADQLPPDCRPEDFPGELWTAAPVLLHAHLESFDAPSESWPRHSFSAWVQALLSWRQADAHSSDSAEAKRQAGVQAGVQAGAAFASRMRASQSAQASWQELRRNGCGTLLTQVSEAGAELSHPQCLVLREIFAPAEADAAAILAQLQSGRLGAQGIALHAPYSVSETLARGAFRWVNQGSPRLLSMHLGEHPEERAYLAEQSGPLAELMALNGRPPKERTWSSPIAWLEDVAPGRQANLLAVHGGDLNPDELNHLQQKAAHLVWCPGTHLYFDRPRPVFHDAGLAAPALGCDSRASNASLDPLREVRLAREILPEFGPIQWWHALTQTGAAALPAAYKVGTLEPGKLAMPLRLSDPGLRHAVELCDYLTGTPALNPLYQPGLPPTSE
jgi:cytosine/adenosine deaminase-related metal-dependent hydrolase